MELTNVVISAGVGRDLLAHTSVHPHAIAAGAGADVTLVPVSDEVPLSSVVPVVVDILVSNKFRQQQTKQSSTIAPIDQQSKVACLTFS